MLRCEACEGSTHQLEHGRSVPICLLAVCHLVQRRWKLTDLDNSGLVLSCVTPAVSEFVRNSSGVYNGGINETTSNCATSAHALTR